MAQLINASENNGFKIIMMHHAVSTPVLYKIFTLGTHQKNLGQDLISYLDDPTSPVTNYRLRRLPLARQFTAREIQKILDNPACNDFDITQLHKCIMLGCENVARYNDPAWYTVGTALEICLYQIKQMRNCAMHESLIIPDPDFRNKVFTLRQVVSDTLTAAQVKYGGQIFNVVAPDITIQWAQDTLDQIQNEILRETDLLNNCSDRLRKDIAKACKDELKVKFMNMSNTTLLSFLMGSNRTVNVIDVYTDIEIEHVGQNVKTVQYKEFLTELQSSSVTGPNKARVAVLEGLAGAGKSTLMTAMVQRWCDGNTTFVDLQSYDIVLPVLCRSSSISSYQQLMEQTLPSTYYKYRGIMTPLLAKCRTLLLLDGLDEATKDSYELIDDIINRLGDADITLICSSRPERLHTLQRIVGSSNLTLIHTRIKGIHEKKWAEFVKKTYEAIQNQLGGERDANTVIHEVEELLKSEFFRLPLMLLLASWLLHQKPELMNVMITQTELFHHIHQLCQDKVLQRLSKPELLASMDEVTLKEKVEEWQLAHCREQLLALTNNQLVLSPEAVARLRSACDQLLSPEELLGACLILKATPTERKYYIPHKGLQEFCAVFFITKTLKERGNQSAVSSHQSPISSSIREILKTTTGGDQDLVRYQNMFMCLAGLLHLYLDPTSNIYVGVAKEVVHLLGVTGVNRPCQWLDVLESTKAAPAVLTAIARQFPHQEITVEDGRVKSYSLLLPHLRLTEVKIKLGDSRSLIPLRDGLLHHTIIALHLPMNQTTTDVDPILHTILSRYITLFEQV